MPSDPKLLIKIASETGKCPCCVNVEQKLQYTPPGGKFECSGCPFTLSMDDLEMMDAKGNSSPLVVEFLCKAQLELPKLSVHTIPSGDIASISFDTYKPLPVAAPPPDDTKTGLQYGITGKHRFQVAIDYGLPSDYWTMKYLGGRGTISS